MMSIVSATNNIAIIDFGAEASPTYAGVVVVGNRTLVLHQCSLQQQAYMKFIVAVAIICDSLRQRYAQ
jgi:hypothetical protein